MIFFVGAGPGDPDLITVKGARLLGQADKIIYAGSLVNPALLDMAKPGCEIFDSAGMTLEEVISEMEKSEAANKMTVRLHTGDPSIYGAIREQMDELVKKNIEFEVVPGVSSFLAAAAAVKAEYTLPDVSQTIILTRMAGRTPVPEKEDIAALAKHRASMAIFLSVHFLDELVEKLSCGYTMDTPAAVVFKASWPEQRVIRGTLADIAAKVREAGVNKTALVLLGGFMGDDYSLSKLYDGGFSHGYRSASK